MKTQIITLLCCCFSIIGFSQSITDVEYFFNTDPGFDNATPITVNANTGDLTQSVSIPIGSLSEGFNSLYFRAKDNLGVWSLYEKRSFYITDLSSGGASNIAAAEYFINTDPGFGSGTAIAVNANTGNLAQTISIPIGNTLEGFNSLYIRTQDDLGTWSLYERKVFYIIKQAAAGATNIAAAEYFLNSDPGFGNGTAIAVNTNTGELNQTISIPINTLEGFNSLYIRTQDNLGIWSLYEKKLFYVHTNQTVSPIVAAEYFYNNDPGFGNATAATITATGNPDEYTIDLATTGIICDLHDFYVRLQNDRGQWSLYDYREDVDVSDNASPTIVVFPNITAELDVNGQASITLADVDNGTFDDCELTSVTLNQPQIDYTCANLGINSVTITATDAQARTSTQNVDITVVDLIAPIAVGQDISRNLSGNASVTITANDVDNGSSDNCNFSLSIDENTFTAEGTYPVVLTATDAYGNTDTTTVMVTIENTLGVEDENISAKNILLYPNPSKGNLFISTNLSIDTIDTYDVSGRHIGTIIKPASKINISNLSTGVYFLKFKIENTFVTKRITKE